MTPESRNGSAIFERLGNTVRETVQKTGGAVSLHGQFRQRRDEPGMPRAPRRLLPCAFKKLSPSNTEFLTV